MTNDASHSARTMVDLVVDSPAVSEGLDVWQRWLATLSALPSDLHLEPAVVRERERAQDIVALWQAFPHGNTPSSPGFPEGMVQLLQARPTFGRAVLHRLLDPFGHGQGDRPTNVSIPLSVEEVRALFGLDDHDRASCREPR